MGGALTTCGGANCFGFKKDWPQTLDLKVLKGHDFSRAEEDRKTGGFIEACKRAGGAELVSPALQRGENGFHMFVTESPRNLLKNSGFVSGHDFSRAVNAAKSMWALAPEGETPRSELLFQQVPRDGARTLSMQEAIAPELGIGKHPCRIK